MVDRSIVQSLGLFNLPKNMVRNNREREEKVQDSQLLNTHKDFFSSEGQEEVKGIDKESLAIKKKREKHLMQLDDTKRMYIDQILRKTAYADDFDFFAEIVGVPLDAEGDGNQGQVVNYKDLSKDQLRAKQEENRQKMRNSQAQVYFNQLAEVLKVTPVKDNNYLNLEVVEFPLRIGYIDKMIADCKRPILELKLNSTFLTATECLVVASNQRVSDLRSLDLSCNPITALGLMNLVHPRRSCFEKLSSLTLFNCEIDYTQAYLISNDNLEECKCAFQLRELNMSHNKLSFFLNYITELDLINVYLEKLQLVDCKLDDEQILSLAESKKLSQITTLDLSENLIERNFQVIIKVLKEKCDFLANLAVSENKGMKHCGNMQITKAKKATGLPLLQRLDLSGCLKGDEQVAQLAQSSYLKDVKFLNLRACKFGDVGLQELLSSKNMRSVQVLIVRDNRIAQIEGPFSDLEEASEKQIKKGLMKLQVLDIRKNKLTDIIQKNAVNFLKETIVIMWNNPFKDDMQSELLNPKHLFMTQELDDNPHLIPNQKHLFTMKKPFFDI